MAVHARNVHRNPFINMRRFDPTPPITGPFVYHGVWQSWPVGQLPGDLQERMAEALVKAFERDFWERYGA